MKILVTADFHIDEKTFDKQVIREAYLMKSQMLNHPRLRLEFQYPALVELLDKVKEVDIVVIAGDIFGLDFNHYSTIAERLLFLEFLEQIKKPIFLLYGNHEAFHDLDQYAKFGKVVLINDYLETEDFKFLSFPGINNPELVKKFLAPSDKILFTHAVFDGAKLDNEMQLKGTQALPSRFDKKPGKLILSGHIHMPQKINDFIFYTGSTDHFNFGDTSKRSFIILDTKTLDLKRIELKNIREFKTFETSFDGKTFNPALPRNIPKFSRLIIRISEEDITKLPFSELEDFYKIEYQNIKPKEKRSRADINVIKQISFIDKCKEYLKIHFPKSNIESILNKIKELEEDK